MSKFVSPSANFKGKINGISIENFAGLNYELSNSKERMKEIEDKLEKVKPFLDEYFYFKEKDEYDNGEFDGLETKSKPYFKYNPKLNEELSEETNICKALELYANYILNSKDLPREKQQQYTILSEDRFKKILQREKSMSVSNNEETDSMSIEQLILDTRPSNDYKNLTLTITNRDLELNNYINNRSRKIDYINIRSSVDEKELDERNEYLIKVLKGYMKMQNHLKEEMRKSKNGEETTLSLPQMIKMMSSIKQDMLQSKRELSGIRNQAKKLGDEKPFNDFSEIDYSNPNHIKFCLKYCSITKTPQPDNMITHIGYDLYNSIKKLKYEKKIDKVDMLILEYYNSGLYTIREIANKINRQANVITQRLNKISKRITEVI